MISVTFCETFVIIHNELNASCALLVAQMDVKPHAGCTVIQKQAFANTTMVPAYMHTHTECARIVAAWVIVSLFCLRVHRLPGCFCTRDT